MSSIKLSQKQLIHSTELPPLWILILLLFQTFCLDEQEFLLQFSALEVGTPPQIPIYSWLNFPFPFGPVEFGHGLTAAVPSGPLRKCFPGQIPQQLASPSLPFAPLICWPRVDQLITGQLAAVSRAMNRLAGCRNEEREALEISYTFLFFLF